MTHELETVEWGKCNYSDIFRLCGVSRKLVRDNLDEGAATPVYSSESINNGIVGYTNNSADFIVDSNNPIYVVFGDHTRSFNIATASFCVMDNVKVLLPLRAISEESLMFVVSSWRKSIVDKGYSRHWSQAKKAQIKLPTKNGEIDFEFMEKFVAELEAQRVAELEAHLSVTGLKNYTLTPEEEQAIENMNLGKIETQKFVFSQIFDQIKQGRRLKKDDQVSGGVPFVMAGVTNTGVVNYISNPITKFPSNSITIDIFGNAFYRNYSYGAGDDTGVYWSEVGQYSKEAMLYMAAAMSKSIYGKFDFGRKLRSSRSLGFEMVLPTKNNQPDFEYMEVLISAIQKLVIKDVVLYADKKINATSKVIQR